MKIGDAIKSILKDRKISVTAFARQTGEIQQGLDRELRGDMRMGKVVSYCEQLGYEVVIRPKRAGRKEEGAYILGADDE